MYTLRRILEDGYEYNFLLGNDYALILKERVSKEEWEAVSKNYWGETYQSSAKEESTKNAEKDCFGFIMAENGKQHFLLPWQKNYIMTESGKTFSRL